MRTERAGCTPTELQGLKHDTATPETLSVGQIASIERRQFCVLKTLLLVGAVAVGVYFVAQALLLSRLLGSP